MPVYKIPLFVRFTSVVGPGRMGRKKKFICVDGWGLEVEYSTAIDLKPKNIRRFLRGRKDSFCFVRANSATEAIEKFWSQWEGARIGGDLPEEKAIYINKDEPLLEYPECEKMKQNQRGEFVCKWNPQYPLEDCGLCTIEGNEPESCDCPIERFRKKFFVLKETDPHLGDSFLVNWKNCHDYLLPRTFKIIRASRIMSW